MKQYSKKLFSLVVLCSTASVMLHADDNHVVPFLQWRSQGRDMARKLYGTTSHAVYQTNDEDSRFFGTFNATLQYDQSFRGKELAQCLFGRSLVSSPVAPATTNKCDDKCDNNDVLVISGLGANGLGTGRAATEWMAENFMLPRDFKSAISFSPKVQDVLVDFNLYVGFDRWCNGLYFRLYGPVVWNKAGLHAEEAIINKGTAAGSYSQGYFDAATAVPSTSLFSQALNFFGGCQLPAYPGQKVTVEPLKFAKFSDCNIATANSCDDACGSTNHKTGFAELRGELGWNYIQDRYRFLLNLQAAAPTGSRPNGEYLFPAQVGNGKHWELGVGLGGSWTMWNSEDGDKSFSFIVEADITHLFAAKQTLTFDLKNKPSSRYMLAQKLVAATGVDALVPPVAGQFLVSDTANGTYAPVANFSTREAKVSFGVQGDLVAMFNYSVRGFSWDLGYNFWALSSSKVKLSDDCSDSCPTIAPFAANTWALKGDASIAGYQTATALAYGIAATESLATIFNGTNAPVSSATINPLTNPGIDAVVTPAVGNDAPNANIDLFINNGLGAARINTSVNPVFISIDDLDVVGAEQRGLSNKVFTHFSYTWTNRDRWVPYVGAGFSAEFGSHSSHDDCPTTTATAMTNDCPSAASCALSKWAVEVKGGVSFH